MAATSRGRLNSRAPVRGQDDVCEAEPADPTPGGLVTTGPYRHVRHPIYAAVLLLVWAGVATHAAGGTLALTALATAAMAVRTRAEQRLVAARYPEYAAYAARTARLVPGMF